MGAIPTTVLPQKSRQVVRLQSKNCANIDSSRQTIRMFLRYLDSLVYNVETLRHVFVEFLAEFRKSNVATVLFE